MAGLVVNTNMNALRSRDFLEHQLKRIILTHQALVRSEHQLARMTRQAMQSPTRSKQVSQQ